MDTAKSGMEKTEDMAKDATEKTTETAVTAAEKAEAAKDYTVEGKVLLSRFRIFFF